MLNFIRALLGRLLELRCRLCGHTYQGHITAPCPNCGGGKK